MNRSVKYINEQRSLQHLKSQWRSAYLSLATRASFPDSGYHYGQLEISVNRLWTKLTKRMGEQRANAYFNKIDQEAQKAAHNYYDKVVFTDPSGIEWTAAELDAAMNY